MFKHYIYLKLKWHTLHSLKKSRIINGWYMQWKQNIEWTRYGWKRPVERIWKGAIILVLKFVKKKGGGLSALILMGEQFCLTISREFLDMHVYVEKPTCIHVWGLTYRHWVRCSMIVRLWGTPRCSGCTGTTQTGRTTETRT